MVGATFAAGIPEQEQRVSRVTHDELLDSGDKQLILLTCEVTTFVTVAFCNTHEIRLAPIPDPGDQKTRIFESRPPNHPPRPQIPGPRHSATQ